MKTSPNITIVVLLAVAVILSAMLIGVYTSQPALAEATMKSGRYIVCAASFSASKDLIYILDMQTKQINVYIADMQNVTIAPVGKTVDLERPVGGGVRP